MFPYKYFIAKEFLFIFWDELINHSLSKKIDELKKFTTRKGVYTKDMVKKIKKDIYILVRQPYLKLSNRRYYTLTSLMLLPIVLMSICFMFLESFAEYFVIIVITLYLRLAMCSIVVVVMVVLPGILYYAANIHENYESKKKYIGLAFAMFGVVAALITSAYTVFITINLINMMITYLE